MVPGGQGVGLQGPRGSRGHLWNPFVPSGWFDETSDDSLGMYACIYCDPDFSCGRVDIQPEVVQEVLADLKSTQKVLKKEPRKMLKKRTKKVLKRVPLKKFSRIWEKKSVKYVDWENMKPAKTNTRMSKKKS